MELFQPILDTIQAGLPKILIISKIRDPLGLSSFSNVVTTSPRLSRSVSDFGPATHKIGIGGGGAIVIIFDAPSSARALCGFRED